MIEAKIIRGYTLIELVTVIIILGIVSTGIFSFIKFGTQVYVDLTSRDQILSESRFLVERLNREIRYALPNSVRVAQYPEGSSSPYVHCIEFTPIQWSAFYQDIATGAESPKRSLDAPEMIGSIITSQEYDRADADEHFVVVYSTQPEQIYSDVNPNGGRRVGLKRVTEDDGSSLDGEAGDSQVAVEFDDYPGSPNGVKFATDSTVQRFYIVSQPVAYCYNKNNTHITRHSGYGFLNNPSAHIGSAGQLGEGVLMAKNVVNTLEEIPGTGGLMDEPFRYSDASSSRNAIVHLLLRFQRNDDTVVYNNEVHLVNVP